LTQYLVVARHPQSEANAELKISADGLYYSLRGSDMLVPQTAKGRRQGQRMGERIARMFPPERKLHHIHHSDFLRVRQALPPITNRLAYEVPTTVDVRLHKRSYGRFWNLTHRGVEALHPDEWRRYMELGDHRDLHYRAPEGGENYLDLIARVCEFIREVVMPSEENKLVLTHSAVVLAMQLCLDGMDVVELVRQYEAQTLPNAHIITYKREHTGERWQRCNPRSLLK
jgi:broad specificity phosphatase PhoE